ncbi:glycoside hydrolase family 24 protein [Parathielavia appendiculata]|uniref:Glycoside hydrolase family 24 protein n=1 Tax=Parathielavia appendiculata TaxID=2587402 RepID=A0AAN6Z109_9PEZI|nr:glycoside hydrolase family 24 protein [Parathielavia appendiculata]
MKLVSIAAVASALAHASAYLITGDTVNCRAGPGTNYEVKRTYSKGIDVTITCQTPGTSVEGHSIWDKTSDGCYVSDLYVETGSDGYVVGKCGTTACVAPKSNQATVDLIAEFEGFEPTIYTDAAGYPTVGYGHLCKDSTCSDLKYSIPLSQADGKKLLADDMTRFERCITAMTHATVNLNQYGALISWSFNMGCGAAETSSLIQRLNNGEDVDTVLSEELPRWVYAGGQVLPGLVRRRNAEIALARTPMDDTALPAC